VLESVGTKPIDLKEATQVFTPRLAPESTSADLLAGELRTSGQNHAALLSLWHSTWIPDESFASTSITGEVWNIGPWRDLSTHGKTSRLKNLISS
jgi:hypothetical protein